MRNRREAGITLVEMIIVVAIIGLIISISFPSVSAGVDSIRLTSATDAIAAFLNGGVNRAERRQEGVEITADAGNNALVMRSTEPNFIRTLAMPDGITIVRVLPPLPSGADESVRRFYLYPAGGIPAVGIEIANRRGAHRVVRMDPMSGVAQVELLATDGATQ